MNEKILNAKLKIGDKVDLEIQRIARKCEYQNQFCQKFRKVKPVYVLDEKLNKLVKTDEVVDIQKELNSNKDCALNVVLDKFLDTGIVDSYVMSGITGESFDRSLKVDDGFLHDPLLEQAEAIQYLNNLRDKYKLGDELSYAQIVEKIIKTNNGLVDKISDSVNTLKTTQKEVKNEKKEIDTSSK